MHESSITNLSRYPHSSGIKLEKGNTLVIYTDNGPNGICGQTMEEMCSHIYIHWFKDEEAMRKYADEQNLLKNGVDLVWGRGGKDAKVEYCTIGEWSTATFKLIQHQFFQSPS